MITQYHCIARNPMKIVCSRANNCLKIINRVSEARLHEDLHRNSFSMTHETSDLRPFVFPATKRIAAGEMNVDLEYDYAEAMKRQGRTQEDVDELRQSVSQSSAVPKSITNKQVSNEFKPKGFQINFNH